MIWGPFLLLSMSGEVRRSFLGGALFHTLLLGGAVALASLLIVLLYKLYKADSRRLFISSAVLFLIIMGLMSWIRHEVRDIYLAPYMEETPRNLRE